MNALEFKAKYGNGDVNIRFNHKDFKDKKNLIMIGGAICTQEMFDMFIPSYCHLFDYGDIKRYGEKIGEVKDLSVVRNKKKEIKPKEGK